MSEHLLPTPGQTVGPFYGYALPYDDGEELVPRRSVDAVRLHGTVTDGEGTPVPDALLEVWQADPAGSVPQVEGSLRRTPEFTGFGRSATDAAGHYQFSTLLPGSTGGLPFFAVTVFARGLLNRLFTRAYLPADDATLEADPFLATVPAQRRHTLVAVDEPDAGGLRFDIRLQGHDETVFLAFPRHQA